MGRHEVRRYTNHLKRIWHLKTKTCVTLFIIQVAVLCD